MGYRRIAFKLSVSVFRSVSPSCPYRLILLILPATISKTSLPNSLFRCYFIIRR